MERSIGSNPRRQSIPAERPATSDRTTVDKNEPLPKNSLPFPALSFRGDSNRTVISLDRPLLASNRTLGDFKSNDCRRSPNLERWLAAPRIERESKPQRTAVAFGVDVL